MPAVLAGAFHILVEASSAATKVLPRGKLLGPATQPGTSLTGRPPAVRLVPSSEAKRLFSGMSHSSIADFLQSQLQETNPFIRKKYQASYPRRPVAGKRMHERRLLSNCPPDDFFAGMSTFPAELDCKVWLVCGSAAVLGCHQQAHWFRHERPAAQPSWRVRAPGNRAGEGAGAGVSMLC